VGQSIKKGEGGRVQQPTQFGSLKKWEKGGVHTISADPKHYVFSNVFEVASQSKPYERVAVAQNVKYVIETARAEGTSPWFAANHDEAAIVMDGDIEVHFIRPSEPSVAPGKEGAVKLAAQPKGQNMGWVKVRRGHMALLPKGAAYQFRNNGEPGVLLVQSIKGETTVERWNEICQEGTFYE
jgi:Cupin